MKPLYAIVCQGEVIGHSDFAAPAINGDVSFGAFIEAEPYERIRATLRAYFSRVTANQSPEEVQAAMRDQQEAQRAIGLGVQAADGTMIPTSFMQIMDLWPDDAPSYLPRQIWVSAKFDAFPAGTGAA
jgi:hypothetical protein